MVVDGNSLLWTGIIGISLFFLTGIVIVIILLIRNHKRTTIRAGFISEGGKITRKRYKRSHIKKTINYAGGKYTFDYSSCIHNKRGTEIYYLIGNPYPLKLTEKGVKTNIDSDNLKAIIETELIAKLFKKEIVTLENVLLFVAIFLCLANTILLAYILKEGVVIKESVKNTEYLTTVFKQVLTTI